MAGLQCIVVTPEKTELDEKVDSMVVPLYDGEMGIAPHRAPVIGRLGYGEMRLTVGGKVQRYFIDGGFVQVRENVVSVLTGKLVHAADLNLRESQDLLEEALAEKAHTAETLEIRERKMSRARGMMRVANRSGGSGS